MGGYRHVFFSLGLSKYQDPHATVGGDNALFRCLPRKSTKKKRIKEEEDDEEEKDKGKKKQKKKKNNKKKTTKTTNMAASSALRRQLCSLRRIFNGSTHSV